MPSNAKTPRRTLSHAAFMADCAARRATMRGLHAQLADSSRGPASLASTSAGTATWSSTAQTPGRSRKAGGSRRVRKMESVHL